MCAGSDGTSRARLEPVVMCGKRRFQKTPLVYTHNPHLPHPAKLWAVFRSVVILLKYQL
jgi:hypothetical protein